MSFLVIPAIDLINGQCVRLIQGSYQQQSTYDREPAQQARKFQEAGFSRLHIVDLEGARSGATVNRSAILQIIRAVNVPVQVGGGIRNAEIVERLLAEGATYLILGTVILEEPAIFEGWLKRWGTEPFIVSLDLKKGRLRSRGWLQEADLDLGSALTRLHDWGISQMICTDVERDGTLTQPGYSTYEALQAQLPEGISLFAAGGVTSPDQLAPLRELGLGGAVVGRALYEGAHSLEDFVGAG